MKSVWRLAALAVAAFVLSAPAAQAAGKTATVKIVNKSNWAIHELYLSPVNVEEWGPDQLRQQVIEPNATFTLSGIPCDTWDVKLVDQDGDECVVPDVDICGGSGTWTIESKALVACQQASQ